MTATSLPIICNVGGFGGDDERTTDGNELSQKKSDHAATAFKVSASVTKQDFFFVTGPVSSDHFWRWDEGGLPPTLHARQTGYHSSRELIMPDGEQKTGIVFRYDAR